VADAADMAGISHAGARKALVHLENLGIAERAGTGRALKFKARDHPFMNLLGLLFKEEHERYESLIFRLRKILTIPEVITAWITELPADTGKALQLEVVAQPGASVWIREELRTRLIETEKKYDMIIELTVFTRADVKEAPNVELCCVVRATQQTEIILPANQYTRILKNGL